MAVTNFTPLLGLALPTTGDLSGTWGTTVNDAITDLLDDAVAGTTTLSADADVTLTTTNGANNQARNAVILWTASNGATTRNITAPAQSKAYIVINAGTGSVVIRGSGPTTGITVASGFKALVAWNGSDFVKVASSLVNLTSDVTGTLPIANGGTGTTSTTFTNLTTNVTGTLPIANGGTGTTSTTFTNLTTNVTGTLPIANGGTGTTSTTFVNAATNITGLLPIANGGTATATPSLVQGSGVTITGTWPNQTINATGTGGTVTAVSVVSSNGFAGSSSGGATPALTLSTSITGVLKGNGTALSAATAGTDYVAPGGALGTPSSGTLTNTTGLPLSTGVTGTLPVANGGTGLTAGTSGGVLAYTASGTLASSAALTQYGVVYGGGAGAVPVATAAGTTGQVLTATTSGAPTWASPAGGGSMIFISTTTASSATFVDITGIDTTYDNYVIMGANVVSNQTYTLGIRILVSGTPYESSYYNAGFGSSSDLIQRANGTSSYRIQGDISDSYNGHLIINICRNVGGVNGIGIMVDATLGTTAGNFSGNRYAGGVVNTSLNGIRIFDWGYSRTNWLSGTFKFYGIKKS